MDRDDFIVAENFLLELKSVEKFTKVHEAQILTYMKIAGIRIGLLINFNVNVLKKGLKGYVL